MSGIQSQPHQVRAQDPLDETSSCPEQPQGCIAVPIPLTGALDLHLALSFMVCPQRTSGSAENLSPTLLPLSLLLHSGSAPQTPAAALLLLVPQIP